MQYTTQVVKKRKCVHRTNGPGWKDVSEAKKWCQSQRSHGLFYEKGTRDGEFWFEFERDALMFNMKWAKAPREILTFDIEVNYPVEKFDFELKVRR